MERGPDDLRDLPEFFGQSSGRRSAPHRGVSPAQIIAGYGQIIEAVEFAAARLRIANTPRSHHGGPHAHAKGKPVVEAK